MSGGLLLDTHILIWLDNGLPIKQEADMVCEDDGRVQNQAIADIAGNRA